MTTKDAKRKRRDTDEGIETVKNAIANAVHVFGIVSKSQLTDEDANVRVIGQFDEEARGAWESLPILAAQSIVDAAISKSEATRQEYKTYKQEMQGWKHESAVKDNEKPCPRMSPDSLIISSLDSVETITAMFSRNLKSTDPDILSSYDSKSKEDVLTEYWGRSARNFVLRTAQDILEMWAKEDKKPITKQTDVFKRRGQWDHDIISATLDNVRGMVQNLIRNAVASWKLQANQYQALFPPGAPANKRDRLTFFVPAPRDLNLHSHHRKGVKLKNDTSTIQRYTTPL